MTAETAPTPDGDVIVPEEKVLELQHLDGVKVTVKRLKTREFLAFTKVLMRGLGSGLIDVFEEQDEDALQGRLIGAVLVAIPEAEFEFIAFVQRMVDPVVSKNKKKLIEYLDNPDIEDLMGIMQVIIEQEHKDLARLGKAAKSWWEGVRATVTADG